MIVIYDYHKVMGLVDTYSTMRDNDVKGRQIMLYKGYKDTYKGKLIIQRVTNTHRKENIKALFPIPSEKAQIYYGYDASKIITYVVGLKG